MSYPLHMGGVNTAKPWKEEGISLLLRSDPVPFRR